MKKPFRSLLRKDMEAFLRFKRSLGYDYKRPEFTLRNFDRFLSKHAPKGRTVRLERVITAWLASQQKRKPRSVACEMNTIRQFCLFLRRRDPSGFVPGRSGYPQSTASHFLPYIFSEEEIRKLLKQTQQLKGAPFRALTYRTLILSLYCTGLRFGEAIRLRLRDIDFESATFFVSSKGRSRRVPFGIDLAVELNVYMKLRKRLATVKPDASFFIRNDGHPLSVPAASNTLVKMFRQTGLNPDKGRSGPRPYDLRHSFAVHRLTDWYRQGVDIHDHLPWLSAYMGHYNLLGTEAYLHATPELLAMAAERFRDRVQQGRKGLL